MQNPYETPQSPTIEADAQMAPPNYATFLQRFVAAFIDGIITGIMGFIGGAILGLIVGSGGGGLAGNFLGLIIGWLYGALLESSNKQATWGKQIMKIKVSDMEGKRISFGRASGRHFAKIISTIILFIGYFMMLWTERKQTLHDVISNCLVTQDKG